MRRAERLFQIVQIMRNKRLVTARDLAERLEVSERTISRDIQDLSLSGVPVEGEAGVGYHLRYSLDIPPLMFNQTEIEALVVAARMLKTWGGKELGISAQSILDKVQAVLPSELQQYIDNQVIYSPNLYLREDIEFTLDICRHAIADQRLLELEYQSAKQEISQRKVRPLGLFFWGYTWTLAAWCELREDFRTFRLDRMHQLTVLNESFQTLTGQHLDDFLDIVRSQHDPC